MPLFEPQSYACETLPDAPAELCPSFKVTFPTEIGASAALAYRLGLVLGKDFEGGTLVVNEWNLWSPDLEPLGQEIVRMIFPSEDIDVTCGLMLHFAESEAAQVTSFIWLAILRAWDCCLTLKGNSTTIAVSHEGFCEVSFPEVERVAVCEALGGWLTHTGD